MLNFIFDFNYLQNNIKIFNNILIKFKFNPESVMVYGSSIGGKMRWDSQLDFQVEVQNGQNLSSWDFEDCNQELSQLLNIKCSVMTSEQLLQAEQSSKINKGTNESILKERLPLKELLQNLDIINALKKDDVKFITSFLQNNKQLDINRLLATDLGKLPILNYAILVDAQRVIEYLLQNNELKPEVIDSNTLNAPQCCVKKIAKDYFSSKKIHRAKLECLISLMLRFSKYLNEKDMEILNRINDDRLKPIIQAHNEKKELEAGISINKEPTKSFP